MNDFDEIRAQLSRFLEAYIEQARGLVTHPSAFFREERRRSGFLDSTLFAAVSLLIPKLLFGLILAPISLGLSLLWVIPSLVHGMLFILVSAILLYAIIRLFGKEASFEPVYNAAAYCCVANYLMIIPVPFLNLMLFLAAYSLLLYIGLRELFDLTPRQSAVIVLIPAMLHFMAGALLTVAAMWLIGIAMLNALFWLL